LGHLITLNGVSADPERIEAIILRYPVPRNSKQLRQFLGVCNFHSRFIIGYAEYASPLYSLLKQGTKWNWDTEKQTVFLKLGEIFAHSIQLIHPNHDRAYDIYIYIYIYTDASKTGISAILTQKDDSGKTLIVSTAS
jgi:hypothetical protein